MSFPLEKAQIDGIEYVLKNPYSICAMDMGLGKAQPKSCAIYTPSGKKTLGEIKVGDYVFGADGKPKRVLGVFPQGLKKTYKITFNDGTTTRSCDEHIWRVQRPKNVAAGKFVDMPLKAFQNNLKQKNGNRNFAIPQCLPLEYPKTSLPIEPYLLGVLIGDGSLRQAGIIITSQSEEIRERIQINNPDITIDRAGETIVVRSPKGKSRPEKIYLDKVGLSVLSLDKFIPKEYLESSVEDRKQLLSGLMDTDGYISNYGILQYCTSSEKLADDVIELIKSLGGIATKKYKLAWIKDKSFPSWLVNFNLDHSYMDLAKKFKRDRLILGKRKYDPRRYFDKVEYFGEEDCVCISVEGSLYLTDHCIVTHNTRIALEVANRRGTTLVVCPSYLILNWEDECKKWFPNKMLTVIRNKKEIYKLWDTDICIVSYENVKYADELFEWAKFVVFDEGQYMKNMAAQRTQHCHQKIYENSIKSMVILTGTPIKNRVEEYYSLIALCNYNPKIKKSEFLERFPDQVTFADHFSHRIEYTMEIRNRFIPVLKWEGLKNKEELKGWLKGIYFRAEAAKGNLIRKDIYVEPANFPDLAEELMRLELGDESIAGKAKQLAAIAMVESTIKYAKEIIEEVGQLVIYSDHVLPAKMIAEAFGVPAVTGELSPEERAEVGKQFQLGKIPVLSATIKGFSTGVTLTAANNMIVNDPPFSPGDLAQAEKRIDRLGQTKRCVIHRMIGSPQHKKIYEILQTKMEIIREVT